MILYKYMSELAVRQILKSRSIGFAKPDAFNDPFELKSAYPLQSSDPVSKARTYGRQSIWADTSGILCLTRNPLNALMWAHYGDEHKGVVLGIDVAKAGFRDVSRCLVPVQFGNVIYTHTRPTHIFESGEGTSALYVGHTHHYPVGHEEKMQRIFLQKAACWSYEEEVRVVKCLSDMDSGSNPSGIVSELKVHNKTLYCYALPEGAIKEIYLGMRHPALQSRSAARAAWYKYHKLCSELNVSACRLSGNTWNIELFDMSEFA